MIRPDVWLNNILGPVLKLSQQISEMSEQIVQWAFYHGKNIRLAEIDSPLVI